MLDESILRNILKHMTINNTEINSSIDLFNSTVEELNCNFQVQKKREIWSHSILRKAIIKTEGDTENCSRGRVR